MKKALTILIIAALVPAALFADFSIGAFAVPTGTTKQVTDAIQDGTYEFFKAENYTFGAQARMKLAILEMDVSAGIQSHPGAAEDDDWLKKNEFPFNVDVGLATDMFGILRLGFTAGLDALYIPANAEDDQLKMGLFNANKAGVSAGYNALVTDLGGDMLAALKASPLRLRATLSAVLGPIMAGLEYSLYTPYCVAAFSDKDKWETAGMNKAISFENSSLAVYAGIVF
ncbi:MAG: hypothetical protein ACTTJZ_06525 [Sphaerochaetaceae bacterium]